jgi:hypothetical protein
MKAQVIIKAFSQCVTDEDLNAGSLTSSLMLLFITSFQEGYLIW